ncbi:MAG: hypothetical protein EA358_10245 [Flavobacteriales bacterium]|nr:MAG: hypothetical protein EA358_10245 [Flavobacteriales bacterium]
MAETQKTFNGSSMPFFKNIGVYLIESVALAYSTQFDQSFRLKPITDSGVIRSAIPLQTDQGFRLKPISYSAPIRSRIPLQTDQAFRPNPINKSGHSNVCFI